jgi:hypothetical protein
MAQVLLKFIRYGLPQAKSPWELPMPTTLIQNEVSAYVYGALVLGVLPEWTAQVGKLRNYLSLVISNKRDRKVGDLERDLLEQMKRTPFGRFLSETYAEGCVPIAEEVRTSFAHCLWEDVPFRVLSVSLLGCMSLERRQLPAIACPSLREVDFSFPRASFCGRKWCAFSPEIDGLEEAERQAAYADYVTEAAALRRERREAGKNKGMQTALTEKYWRVELLQRALRHSTILKKDSGNYKWRTIAKVEQSLEILKQSASWGSMATASWVVLELGHGAGSGLKTLLKKLGDAVKYVSIITLMDDKDECEQSIARYVGAARLDYQRLDVMVADMRSTLILARRSVVEKDVGLFLLSDIGGLGFEGSDMNFLLQDVLEEGARAGFKYLAGTTKFLEPKIEKFSVKIPFRGRLVHTTLDVSRQGTNETFVLHSLTRFKTRPVKLELAESGQLREWRQRLEAVTAVFWQRSSQISDLAPRRDLLYGYGSLTTVTITSFLDLWLLSPYLYTQGRVDFDVELDRNDTAEAEVGALISLIDRRTEEMGVWSSQSKVYIRGPAFLRVGQIGMVRKQLLTDGRFFRRVFMNVDTKCVSGGYARDLSRDLLEDINNVLGIEETLMLSLLEPTPKIAIVGVKSREVARIFGQPYFRRGAPLTYIDRECYEEGFRANAESWGVIVLRADVLDVDLTSFGVVLMLNVLPEEMDTDGFLKFLKNKALSDFLNEGGKLYVNRAVRREEVEPWGSRYSYIEEGRRLEIKGRTLRREVAFDYEKLEAHLDIENVGALGLLSEERATAAWLSMGGNTFSYNILSRFQAWQCKYRPIFCISGLKNLL